MGVLHVLHNEKRQEKHITLFTSSLAGGGVERTILQLAESLSQQGQRVDLVLCRAQGDLKSLVSPLVRVVQLQVAPSWIGRVDALKAQKSNIGSLLLPVLLPLKTSRTVRYLPDLVRYLHSEHPDALLAAKTFPNLVAVWAKFLAQVSTRIVLSEHTHLSVMVHHATKWKRRFILPLVRKVYPRADHIVAVSHGVTNDLVSRLQLPSERVTTIYNPVVTRALLQEEGAPIHHPWFCPPSLPVILSVTRLHEHKDIPTLLRAFTLVRKKRAVRLIILGEGNKRNELETLTRQLGVSDDVSFPGFVPNPLAYMSRAQVFVLSSLYEGLGNVLIEALGRGCPVVSTDCPSGPSEILDHGRYGSLVPIGDERAMAQAILMTLDSSPDRERLRQRASRFSVERATRRYQEIL